MSPLVKANDCDKLLIVPVPNMSHIHRNASNVWKTGEFNGHIKHSKGKFPLVFYLNEQGNEVKIKQRKSYFHLSELQNQDQNVNMKMNESRIFAFPECKWQWQTNQGGHDFWYLDQLSIASEKLWTVKRWKAVHTKNTWSISFSDRKSMPRSPVNYALFTLPIVGNTHFSLYRIFFCLHPDVKHSHLSVYLVIDSNSNSTIDMKYFIS